MPSLTFDFEQQWRNKFGSALKGVLGEDAGQLVVGESGAPIDLADNSALLQWTRSVMERLSSAASRTEQAEIMTSCSCRYPSSDLDDLRQAYQSNGDLTEVHAGLQKKFELFLTDTLQLHDWMRREIVQRSWGLAGELEGNRIIATKIPKSGTIRNYFEETDPEKKRGLYCHCPRIRDAVAAGYPIPSLYCLCGAGFYKGIWEDITGKPVKVRSSLLAGDDVCSFEVFIDG